MNRVIVCGGCGKMASLIATQVYQDADLQLAGIVEFPQHSLLGKDWGTVFGMGETGIIVGSDLEKVITQGDVVVEFTNPDATMEHLNICLKHKKAMVIGTTGLTDEQKKQIETVSKNIPIIISPNMSLGVNLLFELVRKVAGILDDQYDIEIVETHHHFKKDAPSGTAVKIAEIIAQEKNIDLAEKAVYGRYGNVGERQEGEIGIHAIRAGNINGEHTIMFNSLGERLELTHRAFGREAFAQGTIKAIHFIVKQQSGLFSMREVLNL